MKVVQAIHLRTNLVSYPNPNLLVAISKGMQIVKLCCNRIPRVLTGVLAYYGHKMVVCLYTQTIVAYVWAPRLLTSISYTCYYSLLC